MSKALPLTAALVLSGCSAPGGYQVVDWGLPLALAQVLPEGVTAEDILLKGDCYYYRYEEEIYPLPPTEAQRQAGLDRYCELPQ